MKLDKNINYFFLLSLTLLSGLMIFFFMPINKMDTGHDILFHHRRFVFLIEALRDKTFPIYIDYSAFENYGYGTRWFYSDFILIPFAIVGTFTNFIFTYKLFWFVITLLCGLTSYKMMNVIYKNQLASAFTALIYTFSSYRLQDVYERAALGEALSFTFLPIVFLGLYHIVKGDYKKWYVISLGFSLLIFSHLLSTVLTFITVLLFLIIYHKDIIRKPVRLLYLILAGCATVITSSYFLLPFMEQMLHSNFQISIMEYKVGEELSFIQFVKSITYPHAIFAKQKFDVCLGISMILMISLRFFVKEKSKYIKSIDLLVVIGIAYLLLTTSLFDWSKYPLKIINFIQYPWRLFEFCTFFFSIAGGYYLANIAINKKKIILISSFLVLFISTQMFTQSFRYKIISKYYVMLNTELPMTMDIYDWFFITQEYFPENMKVETVLTKGNKIDTQNAFTKISNVERKYGFISCDIETSGNEQIEFPLTYYKGYTATLNGKPIKVRESKYGLVEIETNHSGKLTVQFTGTFLQKYSIYITLISFILLGLYIIIYNRKKKNNA